MILMIALLAISQPIALPAPAGFGGEPWAEFSKEPALKPLSTTIAIGTLPSEKGGNYRYWLRKAVFGDRGRTLQSITWIDSRSCPAASQVISKMAAVSVPTPAPYGVPKGSIYIITDGVNYRLKAPAAYPTGNPGTVEITSNVGTPLANWIETSVTALEPCWKSEMP